MSNPFEGAAVNSYLQGPPRQVPGFDGLLRMATQLLHEKVKEEGNILALGAGGGLEIREMAATQPEWHFEGVDPSREMLDLAAQTTKDYTDRITLRHGFIDSASNGPFDGATCLLTMHFVSIEERLPTLLQIRERLKPGAPFVMAHISFSQEEPDRQTWIHRHVTFAGTAPEHLEASKQAIATRLTILSPNEEESLLKQAGFSDITLFYAGLSFRGWVAYAG